ncbi:MAG: ATP-binding protein [Elusimicrobiaceae bacterium]
MPRKRGKLFTKLLLILLLVSLLPLSIAGYYMLSLSRQIMKQTALADQQTLAVGLSDTVYNYTSSFRNVLFDAVRLTDLQADSVPQKQAAINHLMQLHAAFLEMSMVGNNGVEIVHAGRFVQDPQLRDFSQDPVFIETMKNGEYMGSLKRFMRQYPTLTLGVQIIDNDTGKSKGAIIAQLSLNGLSSILKTGFPQNSEEIAAVVSADGFLIAHSDVSQVFAADSKMPRAVEDLLMRNPGVTGGKEIVLADGVHMLGAFAAVKDLDWTIYIQKPVSVVVRASEEMLNKTLRVFAVVVALVFVLGYVFSVIIVKPIIALREAAVKLGEGEESLPQLRMPDDEIGDLAQTFIQMSENIHRKHLEILSAKNELEQLNRSLESRVDARTRELKSAHEELVRKERLAAIGQMSSVVSHEIRNPLAVINNSAYFIKTKLLAAGPLDPKIEKHIGIMEAEIQQANGIINEILGFARTRELMLKPVKANEYLEDVVSSYPLPEHIEVVKKYSPDNPWINIDSEEFKQALRNLVGNAAEVMPEKGTLTVESVLTGDNMVRLSVSDTGCGIPPEVADKIFAPFFTTKARGTGLGLAVVKKVVDRHRGRVEIESIVGQGTTFMLYIPLYVQQAGA